jgi:hypothetical protein
LLSAKLLIFVEIKKLRLFSISGQRLENSQSDGSNKQNGGEKATAEKQALTRKPSRPNSRIMSFFQRS